jgi:hypothetical protein
MFILHNKLLNKDLIHPRIGLWYTNDLAEAVDLLEVCKKYVIAEGLESSHFVILDMDTREEVNLETFDIAPQIQSQ